jgi:hypothetical protein
MSTCSNGYEKYGHLFSDREITEEFLSEVNHRFYEHGDDAGCFIEKYPGVWESHYLCTSRGRDAFTSTHNVLREFFNNEDAAVITGAISKENRAARLFTRKVGFTSLGFITYPEGDYELFILTKKDYLNG